MARLGLWLRGLQALPEERYGRALPALWGQGEGESIAAPSNLHLAARLLGLPEPLAAAAFLAVAEGVEVAGRWVTALEPVSFGGQAGRLALAPAALPGEAESAALFAAAAAEFSDSPWQLARGARRWYVLRDVAPDLRSSDPNELWGREPPLRPWQGQDAAEFQRFLNALQMFLAVQPSNRARDAAAEDICCHFWAWGEGSLPVDRPTLPWQALCGADELLHAVAQWAGIRLWDGQGAMPDGLLWSWPQPWFLPETATAFAELWQQIRPVTTLEIWTGRFAEREQAEHLRWRSQDRWRFWRRPRLPGGAREAR